MLRAKTDVTTGDRTLAAKQSNDIRPEELVSLLDMSPQSLAVFQNLQLVFANAAFLDLIGVESLAEGAGDRPFHIFSSETAKMIISRHKARLNGETLPETYEVDFIRRDGSPGRLVITAKLLTWNDKPALLVACNDITERHQATQALQASEARYRTMVEGAVQGMAIIQDDKIVFGNHELQRFLRANSLSSLLGMNAYDFARAEDRDSLAQIFQDILRGEKSHHVWLSEAPRLDGSKGWAVVDLRRIIWEGRPGIQATGVDVTETRLAEIRLNQQAQILDLLEEGVMVSDEMGRVEYWNAAAERMTGRSASTLIGQPIGSTIPVLDSAVNARFLAELERDGRWEGEMRLHIPDQNPWFQVSIIRFCNPTNGATNYISVFRDVTDRVETRESLERQATVLELTDDGVIFTGPDNIMLEANPAALEIFGRSREDLIGQPSWTLFSKHLEDFSALRAVVNQEMALSGRWHNELQVQLDNGRLATLAVTLVNTQVQHNQPAGRLIFVRDVTEWRRTQTSLRRQAIVMALMEESTLITDGDGIVTELNASAQRTFGFERSEITGQPIEVFLPGLRLLANQSANEAGAAKEPYLDAILERHGRLVGETETRRKNGQTFLASYNVVPFYDVVGAPRGMIFIIRNITRQREQERELQTMMQELEAKNTELEQFTYTVSHDLRSPLITIRGFIDLLDQDIRDGAVERVEADTARIRLAAERMDQMLSELLRLSRVGRVLGKIENIPLRDIVFDALIAVSGRLEGRNIVMDVDDNLPVIACDRIRTIEVFQNLLDNAIKFMGDQLAPRIRVGSHPSPDGTVVFVSDNGVGIDPRYHDKIFGLFDTLAPGAEGTGIGLAIVKRVIEKHGGRIWVESQGLGAGTTFYLLFPASKGEV